MYLDTMMRSILISLLAFSGLTSGLVVPQHSLSKLKAGSTQPLENFDPLNLCNDERALFFREAELKHGRLAMASAAAFPIIETVTHKTAVNQFQELPDWAQASVVASMFGIEFTSMIRGWEMPFGKNEFVEALRLPVRSRNSNQSPTPIPYRTKIYVPGKTFTLKEDYQPGDFGFGLKSKNDITLQNKELNNGRLAMIGALGIMAQELVTGSPVF